VPIGIQYTTPSNETLEKMQCTNIRARTEISEKTYDGSVSIKSSFLELKDDKTDNQLSPM